VPISYCLVGAKIASHLIWRKALDIFLKGE